MSRSASISSTTKNLQKSRQKQRQRKEEKETEEIQKIKVPVNTPEEDEKNSNDINIEETSSIIFDLIEKEYAVITEASKQLKLLQKRLKLVLKKEMKPSKKNLQKTEKNTNRVVTKKPIIDNLSILMGVPKNTELSRQEVHKFICKYVKEHNLQDQSDKKCFRVDKDLESVLGKPKFKAHNNTEKISHSYTNLLKMLSSLFKD